jgi:hypothetical protein
MIKIMGSEDYFEKILNELIFELIPKPHSAKSRICCKCEVKFLDVVHETDPLILRF